MASWLMSLPTTPFTPYERRSRLIPSPAAPSPTTPTTRSSSAIPESRVAFRSAASTTTAVPCWSSCMTGIGRVSTRRRSISKHSGAAMSSSWIAPKDGAIWVTVSTKVRGSRVGIRIGIPDRPAKRSSRTAFPSMTGRPACTPMLPSPSTAVPLVTMATVRPSAV